MTRSRIVYKWKTILAAVAHLTSVHVIYTLASVCFVLAVWVCGVASLTFSQFASIGNANIDTVRLCVGRRTGLGLSGGSVQTSGLWIL